MCVTCENSIYARKEILCYSQRTYKKEIIFPTWFSKCFNFLELILMIFCYHSAINSVGELLLIWRSCSPPDTWCYSPCFQPYFTCPSDHLTSTDVRLRLSLALQGSHDVHHGLRQRWDHATVQPHQHTLRTVWWGAWQWQQLGPSLWALPHQSSRR